MYFALSAGLRIDESLEAISEGSGIPVAQLKAFSDSPAAVRTAGQGKEP